MAIFDELSLIISIIAIMIPVMVLLLSRHLSGSDRLSKNSTYTRFTVDDMQQDIKGLKDEVKDLLKRVEALDKGLYNLCWRVENLEGKPK